MGGLFESKTKTGAVSTLSPTQQALQGPLFDFFSTQLGGGLVNTLSERIFTEGLLGPSLRGFERQTRPAIEAGFARIGGTLGSRREKVLADVLGDIHTGAQSNIAQALPQLIFEPLRLANQFALQGTQQPFVETSPSLFSQILGGVGLAGSILGTPFGAPTATGFGPGTGLFASKSSPSAPSGGKLV